LSVAATSQYFDPTEGRENRVRDAATFPTIYRSEKRLQLMGPPIQQKSERFIVSIGLQRLGQKG
jgi:hypothetical protein